MQDNENPTQENKQEEQLNTTPQELEMSVPVQPVAVQPKNKFSKKLAAGLAVLLLLIAGGAFTLLSKDTTKENNVAQQNGEQQKVTTLGASLALIEGTVEYSNDGENWSAAEQGSSLANLDYVRTGENGRAIVLFDNGSVARLNNDTTLYLSSLEASDLQITLVDGEIYNRVVESDAQTYTVVTANERFTALGTAYNTSTNGEKDVLDVYQSSVKVVSSDSEVTEGNKYSTDKKEVEAIDLDKLKDDEFAQWNKDKDSEIDEFKDKLGVFDKKVEEKEEEETPSDPSNPAGISLRGEKTSKGVKLSWTVTGLNTKQGFKVVKDTSDSTPSYGENSAVYVSDPATRSFEWKIDTGKTYYFRVCIYNEGTCANYSNAVQVAAPKIEKEKVVSGDINLSINGNKLSWSLSGGTAPYGYKVVLSGSSSPTYPENSIEYTGKTTSTLPDKAPGTYYVRVCKYTNGTQSQGCVDYSNQVEYIVSAEE